MATNILDSNAVTRRLLLYYPSDQVMEAQVILDLEWYMNFPESSRILKGDLPEFSVRDHCVPRET